ncbi:MAG: hypothetical protein VKJ06_00335 [Vampirovibrionales bacterium]|nr:hypothetical protein [Vampirovibrionales bacterium]
MTPPQPQNQFFRQPEASAVLQDGPNAFERAYRAGGLLSPKPQGDLQALAQAATASGGSEASANLENAPASLNQFLASVSGNLAIQPGQNPFAVASQLDAQITALANANGYNVHIITEQDSLRGFTLPAVGTCLNQLDTEATGSSLSSHLKTATTKIDIQLQSLDAELDQCLTRLKLLKSLSHASAQVRYSALLLEQRIDALTQKKQKLQRLQRLARENDHPVARQLSNTHEAVAEQLTTFKQAMAAPFNLAMARFRNSRLGKPLARRVAIAELARKMSALEAGLQQQLKQPQVAAGTVSTMVAEFDSLSAELSRLSAQPGVQSSLQDSLTQGLQAKFSQLKRLLSA